MPITLNEALSAYTTQRLPRLAQNTQDLHNYALDRWKEWVVRETQPNVYLQDIDDMTMSRYFNRLRPPMYAERSFNNFRQYLMSFWKYCTGNGWVKVNPMRYVDPLRVPSIIRLQLSAIELLGMLEEAETPRDRFGLALGMNTGLRAMDAATLFVGDLNLHNDTLRARIAKTQTEDTIPVTADLHEESIRWLTWYAEKMQLDSIETVPNTYRLLPAFRGVPVGGNAGFRSVIKPFDIYRHPEDIVKRALARRGFATKGEGFHTLRRSAGRAVFDLAVAEGVGDPIRVAQAFLGHKNQATTEIYLGITFERRQRDEMLKGQSFLGRVAENDAARNLGTVHATAPLKEVRHA